MTATAHQRGHLICFDKTRNEWVYADDGSPCVDCGGADIDRPCVRCGQMPTDDGHDACLGHIPGVRAACCGHGVTEPYVRRGPKHGKGERERMTDKPDLTGVIEEVLVSMFDEAGNYLQTMFPDRPYDGQPHTCAGERGRTEVRGLTMRDIQDCFIRAAFTASGLPEEAWPKTVYDLPWDLMDPIAVAQVMGCEIEKRMGIYPNVPPLKERGSE